MKNNNLPKHEDILNKPAFVVSLKRASARYQHTKKLLKDVLEDNNIKLDSEIDLNTSGLNSYNSEDSKIIE